MALTCLQRMDDGRLRSLTSCLMKDEEWNAIYDVLPDAPVRRTLRMTCCNDAAIPCENKTTGTRFFRHPPGAKMPSRWCHVSESEEHQRVKQEVVNLCVAAGWDARPEVIAEHEEWRADVLAEKDGRKIAIEVQFSKQTPAEYRMRTDRYREDGVECLWLVGHEGYEVDRCQGINAIPVSLSGQHVAVHPSFANSRPYRTAKLQYEGEDVWFADEAVTNRVCRQAIPLGEFLPGFLEGAWRYGPPALLPATMLVEPQVCPKCGDPLKVGAVVAAFQPEGPPLFAWFDEVVDWRLRAGRDANLPFQACARPRNHPDRPHFTQCSGCEEFIQPNLTPDNVVRMRVLPEHTGNQIEVGIHGWQSDQPWPPTPWRCGEVTDLEFDDERWVAKWEKQTADRLAGLGAEARLRKTLMDTRIHIPGKDIRLERTSAGTVIHISFYDRTERGRRHSLLIPTTPAARDAALSSTQHATHSPLILADGVGESASTLPFDGEAVTAGGRSVDLVRFLARLAEGKIRCVSSVSVPVDDVVEPGVCESCGRVQAMVRYQAVRWDRVLGPVQQAVLVPAEDRGLLRPKGRHCSCGGALVAGDFSAPHAAFRPAGERTIAVSEWTNDGRYISRAVPLDDEVGPCPPLPAWDRDAYASVLAERQRVIGGAQRRTIRAAAWRALSAAFGEAALADNGWDDIVVEIGPGKNERCGVVVLSGTQHKEREYATNRMRRLDVSRVLGLTLGKPRMEATEPWLDLDAHDDGHVETRPTAKASMREFGIRLVTIGDGNAAPGDETDFVVDIGDQAVPLGDALPEWVRGRIRWFGSADLPLTLIQERQPCPNKPGMMPPMMASWAVVGPWNGAVERSVVPVTGAGALLDLCSLKLVQGASLELRGMIQYETIEGAIGQRCPNCGKHALRSGFTSVDDILAKAVIPEKPHSSVGVTLDRWVRAGAPIKAADLF